MAAVATQAGRTLQALARSPSLESTKEPPPSRLASPESQQHRPDGQRESSAAKRQKVGPESPLSPLAANKLAQQRRLELQSFTGYPHLRVQADDGHYRDATVEKMAQGGIHVGYEQDGTKEVIDLSKDLEFRRLRSCGDLTFGDLEDACSAAVDADSDQEDESCEQFEVERILSTRLGQANELVYEVSWKGYSEEHNTFEPKSNLTHCKQLILDFESRQAGAICRPSGGVKLAESKPTPAVVGGPQADLSKASWDEVEGHWMRQAAVCQQKHVRGALNYCTIGPGSKPAEPEEGANRCCARWGSRACSNWAAPGKGYCEHHIALLKARLLGEFLNFMTAKEELAMMRKEDVRL